MTLNNLTGTYHVTVTPGSGNYASSLNIAQTGVIEPVAIGANGIYLAPGIIGSTIYNFGVVRSGNGSGTVASGDGVLLEASATLFNHGIISSGSTANRSSPGGIGVDLTAGGNLINDGVINGSYGLGSGTGVLLALGGNITNSDYISGGGGRFGAGGPGGSGGDGVILQPSNQSLLTVSTNALVTGGNGGGTPSGIAGAGGIGVNVGAGAAVINNGTIEGGRGGYVDYSYSNGSSLAGNGGNGVLLDGGTLTNAGTISGGAAGLVKISGPSATAGDAVQFGTLASTLIIDPGAIFNGNVAANGSVNDVLELAGTTAGTLSGLGTQFTAFTTLEIAAGAAWSLTGPNSLGPATTLTDQGSLTVTGALTDSGKVTISKSAILSLSGAASIQAGSLALSGGTLRGSTTGSVVIGNSTAKTGDIKISTGAAVSGYGAITGAAVINAGTVIASGGTLTFADAVSGPGKLEIGKGAKLTADAAVSAASVIFETGGGTLLLGAPTSMTSEISGFAAKDVIDLAKLTVTNLSFSNGTLTLINGTTTVDTLQFQGTYTTANFHHASDGHGGTSISFVT